MKKMLTHVSATVLALGLFFSTAVPAFALGTWAPTGSMTDARALHTATLLQNGTVLVAGGLLPGGGGVGDMPTSSTELYYPSTGTWALAASMNEARAQHTATPLLNGKVLVAGGRSDATGPLSSAELYDPSTDTWTPTGPMNEAREFHTATLLLNGKVLAAGGLGSVGAELYDPATNSWSPTGPMNEARGYSTATLLLNGKVLVAGGNGSASAELYDPATNSWSPTGSMTKDREMHSATLLRNGKVLVSGGWSSTGLSSDAELYDPSTGTWTVTGSMNSRRAFFTTVPFPDGTVLASGGIGPTKYDANTSAELYDAATGIWTQTGSMNEARRNHTATLLPNGTVLVAGGLSASYGGLEQSSAELYTPANSAPTITPIGDQTVTEGNTLVIGVTATDTDGDTLTYSASNLPSGATFDPDTAIFSWTPSYSQAGTYPDITFTVTDNGTPVMSTSTSITITVVAPTPTQLSQTIINTVTAYNFPTNIQNSLFANLQKLQQFIGKGQTTAARNQVNAFLTKLQNDLSANSITQSEYDTLSAQANALLGLLQ